MHQRIRPGEATHGTNSLDQQMWKMSVCIHVPNVFVRCMKAVYRCTCMFPEWYSSSPSLFAICPLKLTSNQSARNSVPYTRSCYGICSLTRLIYFPFLLHTWQTVLSSPTWPGGPPAGKCLGRGNIWTAELAAGVTAALRERWKHVWNALPLSGLLKMKSG